MLLEKETKEDPYGSLAPVAREGNNDNNNNKTKMIITIAIAIIIIVMLKW
jgi:hypothetical protein